MFMQEVTEQGWATNLAWMQIGYVYKQQGTDIKAPIQVLVKRKL